MSEFTMKKAKRFVLWTFIVSYLYAAVFYFIFNVEGGMMYLLMASGYMWIPGIIAIILYKKEKRRLRDAHIFIKFNRWFVFSWLVFVFITFLVLPVNALFPGAEFSIEMESFIAQYQDLLPEEDFQTMMEQITGSPWQLLAITIVQGLFAGITINAFFAFGEELGWRGYLYEALEPLNFWKHALISGVIWGLWHAPLIMQGHNYPGYPIIGIFMMVIWCILLSPLFILIRMKTKSVIGAAIAHGTLNGTAAISIIYINGGHTLINGIAGISGWIVLLMVNGLIALYFKKKEGDTTYDPQTRLSV